jgi:hypothetical protein
MNPLTITIMPERERTRILMVCGQTEVMKAVLGPTATSHPRAAATLLEGLSLWHQTPLSVVLSVDAEPSSSGLSLCDALGFGHKTLHYEVAVALRERHPRRRMSRLPGLGDFRELRQLCLEGVGR